MENSVAIVLLTYNRKELLLECLEAIQKLTVKPDALYIVDNNSNDGTKDLLYEKKFIPELPKNNINSNQVINSEISSYTRSDEKIVVRYINKYKNEGSAGGFNEGMKMAFNDGYEWIWVMDDDVEPKNNALEILYKWRKTHSVIQTSREYKDGSLVHWAGYFIPESGLEYHPDHLQSCLENSGHVFVSLICFEGLFINRKIIEKIGFPDKRFFIAGDDSIYGFLASLYTNIVLIKEKLIIKKIKFEPPIYNFGIKKLASIIPPFWVYYKIRNEFLKMKIMREQGITIHKEAYKKRIRKIIILELLFSLYTLDLKRLKSVITGYIDGKRGWFY